MIAQFKLLKPRVHPHAYLVFLSDPFADWDMAFIAELYFRDPTLHIHLQRLNPQPEAEIAAADAVFDYREGKLIQVR